MENAIANTKIASEPTAGASVTTQGKLSLLLKKLLAAKSHDKTTDIGLLVLRIIVSMSLFIKHGIEKITPGPPVPGHPNFAVLSTGMPDPLHIGHFGSFLFAMTSDAICSILVLLGLGTRPASLFIVGTLTVAQALVNHFAYFGTARNLPATHGEMIIVYWAVYIAFAIIGPGKYSLDWLLWRRKENSKLFKF